MKLKSKKVLITGAGGFIGSHLAEALITRGCTVKAMLHYDSRPHRGDLEFVPDHVLREMEILRGNICDPHFMLRVIADCDVVFHLAALIAIPYSYHAPTSYVDTNVMGTLNVMEACRFQEVERVIHTSTSECYGTAVYVPINEKHPLQGQSPYSASKIGADKIVESFHLSFGLPVTTLRPFNTFGPRQSARAIIPTIFSSLLSGSDTLRLGSLTPVRDMNYIANTIDAFIKIAECDESIGEVINAGSGRGLTIRQIAEVAMKITGKQVPLESDVTRIRPEKSEVMTLVCDNSKAAKLMNWTPSVLFEKGMEETSDFIARYLNNYRPENYVI